MLNFNLTKDNYISSRKVYMRYEAFQRLFIELIGAVLVLVMTTIIVKVNHLPLSIYFISMGVWILFCLFCNLRISKENNKEISNGVLRYENMNMFGDNKISILDEGINIYNNKNTKIYPWKAIKNIKQINGNLYIFLSTVDYICIPKEAYNKEEFRVFVNGLETYKLSFIAKSILRV